jgi:hypothetical protein
MTTSPPGSERRRHPRIAVTSQGRFLAADGTEHVCSIQDVSLNGLAVLTEINVMAGSKIILYLDDLGRFEGTVTRLFKGGFAIETALAGPRRQRLADRLASIARGEKEDYASRRAFTRLTPAEAGLEEGSMLALDDGTSSPCRIVDMSLGGANVETEVRPNIGMHISIGRMRGRVVRHTAEGVAIEFEDIPENATAMSRPFSRS